MALKGSYNYKGIDLSDAYVKITGVTWSTKYVKENYIKKEAVLDNNGSIIEPEVMGIRWVDVTTGSWTAAIHKDKDARDSNPGNSFCTVFGNFDMDLKATAKNPVKQAYVYLKSTEAYKDYTDV